MASKLINFVALSTIAILAASFGPTSTNALAHGYSGEHAHLHRRVNPAPAGKRKRGNTGRCKAKSSSLASTTHTTTTESHSASSTSVSITSESKPTTSPSSPHATSDSQPKAPASAPHTTSDSTPTTASSTKVSETPKSSSSATPAKPVSSKPSATPSSSSSSSGKFGVRGSKGCLAWGGDTQQLANFKTEHVVGLYNWGPNKPDGADAFHYDFWPMLWGGDGDKISAFEKAMQSPNPGTMILGFNEPNEPGQSNMDPQTAASLWKQHIDPKCRNGHFKCCSPAMSSRPNGQQWMADFMKACPSCKIDYQCLHWYDIGFDNFKKYLTDYHNQINLPILITEFADQNFNGGAQANQDQVFQFMSQALEFIDQTDWILAGCPFGAMENLQGVNTLDSLMNPDGTPSALGSLFIDMKYS